MTRVAGSLTPEKLVARLRDSFDGAEHVYKCGSCYQLFLVLRTVWPDAEPWYDHVAGHIYTRIGRHWYDIDGKHLRVPKTCLVYRYDGSHAPHRWGRKQAWRLTPNPVRCT